MRHIRQICKDPYIVVIAQEPLEEHNSIKDYPELFEIVDEEIPENVQYLNYNK